MAKQPKSDRDPGLVDLALQGGGSHGAFTWGVLDRLLEEPWLRIDGISGTSAGAMNGAVLVAGYTAGGAEGARAALDAFWKRVSHSARFSPIRRSPLDVMLGRWTLDTSPFYLAFDLASRVFSPYDLAPSGTNPLRDVLAESVDFAEVARAQIKLDGEAYWDGGYSGNPTITPLVRECKSQDTLLVAVNPVERAGTPRSAREILDRLNEVSFNATLLKELRMIALLRQVADAGSSEGAQWAHMRIHLIASELLSTLGASSKFNAEWDFLRMLRDEGRRAAEAFISAKADNIGKQSSIDLDILLQQV